MNLIQKIPGPFLIFLGACSLSFGGLIVKSFEGANLWQILFWRSLFFIIIVTIFLFITYKKKAPNKLKDIINLNNYVRLKLLKKVYKFANVNKAF